ncbi:hypothetical protein ACH4JS_36140 [Streptomyces sp. NPDC017638]|uniref:hypothetical protein n=1 Tax=Streptomyces sp. NPDC017638 TaxID=3365004 RepID=UPI0037AB0D52
MSLESKDIGLHYQAVIRYRWWIDSETPAALPTDLDALVRRTLSEQIAKIATEHKISDRVSAQKAMNDVIGRRLRDVKNRLSFEGRVRLVVPRFIRKVARRRFAEETELRSVHARQTVELELLLERMTDKTLGPVWWVNQYADIGSEVEDPQKHINRLAAFRSLQKALDDAKSRKLADEHALVRGKIDEIFNALQDEQSLALALQVMNRMLDHLGAREDGSGSADIAEHE